VLTAEIRLGLEGMYPSTLVTSNSEGIPNITMLSQVWYVDDNHVATSYQFFNKTKINLALNPNALARIICPDFSIWDLQLIYIHTETSGAIFEIMAVNLEGIASYMGMTEIFKLKGADIYKVLGVRKGVEYWEASDRQ